MKLVRGPLGELNFPDEDSWMAHEYQKGSLQHQVLNEAYKFLTKTRLAVDCGAHIGVSALELKNIFDTVYCFEPCRETFYCLVKNTLPYTNISPHNYALGDCFQEMSMAQDDRYQGNTGGNYLIAKKDLECYNTVYTIRLDQYSLDSVDLIKIDAEGFEKFVLLGAIETIKRSWPVIVCEEKNRLMRRQGVGDNEVRLFLENLGYKRVSHVNRDFVYAKG